MQAKSETSVEETNGLKSEHEWALTTAVAEAEARADALSEELKSHVQSMDALKAADIPCPAGILIFHL